jgi:hypothetical protein
MSDKPGTFAKGDKRINRKGRPRSFDELRKLAQQISHETIETKSGDKLTVAEAIMRSWAQSKDARLQQAFINYAYGAPPTKTEVSGPDGGPIVMSWSDFVKNADPGASSKES